MKSVLFSLLLIGAVSSSYAQQTVATDPALTARAEKYAKEVYKYTPEYASPQNIAIYAEWLSRTEVKTQPASATEQYTKLSSVGLKDKYNVGLQRDNAQTFNPQQFNALKYFLDFYTKTEKIYRVDGTDYVIVIHPKS